MLSQGFGSLVDGYQEASLHCQMMPCSVVSQNTVQKQVLYGNFQKDFTELGMVAQLLNLSCFQTLILDCRSVLIK